MFIVHQKKVLGMLQVVIKETQSLLLTFNRFHISFYIFYCQLWVIICLLAKVFQRSEQQQLLFMLKVSNENLRNNRR